MIGANVPLETNQQCSGASTQSSVSTLNTLSERLTILLPLS